MGQRAPRTCSTSGFGDEESKHRVWAVGGRPCRITTTRITGEEREAEARQIADNLTDEKARKLMIGVAEGYARLARLAQQRLLAKQKRT